MANNNDVYSNELNKMMKKYTGIDADMLTWCIGSQNATVSECPVAYP